MASDHFVSYGVTGSDFRVLALVLATRMYRGNVRSALLGLNAVEPSEAIVLRATAQPPEPAGRAAFCARVFTT